jgi:hypothetical protein
MQRETGVFNGQWQLPKMMQAPMAKPNNRTSISVTNTPVTSETYIRAGSDRQFGFIVTMAGGVNRFYHFRSVTQLEKQNVSLQPESWGCLHGANK